MTPDESDLRKALEARSGEPSPDFRARVRQSLAGAAPRPAMGWTAAVAVMVVTALTATSVAVLVASRHSRPGAVASAPRVVTPSPVVFPTESPVVLPGTAQLSAPSADVVWVLLNYDHLYRSMDRGATWTRWPLPTDPGVRPVISFIDDHEGWLLAPGSPATECQEAPARIWHTTDAGATWQILQANGLAAAQCKDGVYFADARHGFVTAWDDLHRPTVYATSDGGQTWHSAVLPDGPLFVTQGGGFTLRVDWIKTFGATAYLEATGMQDDASWPLRTFIYTSTDGGATWRWRQKLASAQTVMVTETRWLQYDAPNMMESVNGGQAFGPYSSDFGPLSPVAGGTVMVFAGASTGYATGRGQLEATTDGGAHWTVIPTPGTVSTLPSPTPSPILSPADVQISAPSAGTAWAIVNSSYLFRSLDGGQTWTQRTFPAGGPGGKASISFVDDFHGYALFPGEPATQCTQASASLYATSDGAATWNLVAIVKNANTAPQGLPFEQCKDYVYFLDRYWGFVASHDALGAPVISTTQNGGKTWTQQTLPAPPIFKGAAAPGLRITQIRNFVTVMLLQAEGVDPYGKTVSFVYESTDGGLTWTFVVATLPNLEIVTSTRWVAPGDGGSLVQSDDRGASWTQLSPGLSNVAAEPGTLVFATPDTGYAVVEGGVYRTVDGGAHWAHVKYTWP